MDRWADGSTLGKWLHAQNAASLVELWRITREFVGWVLLKAKSSRGRGSSICRARPVRGGR
jgi:hypothetical protein